MIVLHITSILGPHQTETETETRDRVAFVSRFNIHLKRAVN